MKTLIAFLLFASTAFAQGRVAGLTASELKTFQSLNAVENTALSTWAGTSSITTLGTIGTGVWQGTIITSAYGGTGNGFTKFSGPTTSEKTFTLPNASATILTDNALVTVAQGGTGANTLTNHGVLIGSGTSAVSFTTAGTSGQLLTSQGASSNPTWTTATYPATAGTSGNVLTSDGTNWTSSAPTGGLTTTAITADQTAAVGNAYINNKAGSILSITLPTTASVGQQIKVYGGTNTASFKFVYSTSQKIHYGTGTSTVTTGNVTASEEWAVATLTCIVANNEWILEGTGTFTLN